MASTLHADMASATSAPTNDEAQPGDTALGPMGQRQADEYDFATVAAKAEADKAFTTLRATLALRGFELHIVGDGEGGVAYMVHRWTQSRTLPDLAAVARFLDQVGGAHA